MFIFFLRGPQPIRSCNKQTNIEKTSVVMQQESITACFSILRASWSLAVELSNVAAITHYE